MSQKMSLKNFENLEIELIIDNSEVEKKDRNINKKFSFENIILKKEDFSKKETNKKNCRFFKNIDFIKNDKIARVLF